MTSGQYSFGRRSYRGRIHRMQGADAIRTTTQFMPKSRYAKKQTNKQTNRKYKQILKIIIFLAGCVVCVTLNQPGRRFAGLTKPI